MITSPFLTDLDSRAAVKGSRDPLGIQSIWTRFGRHVVGNLSTVTNSVRDFTILMLGYHFAEQVAETSGPGSELSTFLKWEQMAGYARASVNREEGFRGTERVWRNLEDEIVTVSAETRHQILSSQKLYGIWGLYTVPSRSSGLLDGDPARLRPSGREAIQRFYLPQLTQAGFKDGNRIADLLAQDRVRFDPKGADKKLFSAIASLITQDLTQPEKDFYRDHLLFGGPEDSTQGRQRQLAELLKPKLTGPAFEWSPPALSGLAKEAETQGQSWDSLAGYLRRIAVAETLLAPASALFIYLLGCQDAEITDVVKRIHRTWGGKVRTVDIANMPALEAELGGADPATGQRWLAIAHAMAGGEYAELVRLLLAQNRAVMQLRGGSAAWLEEQNGRIRVRTPDEQGELPSKEELPTLWRFPYFLDSLCAVAFVLNGGHNA